MGTGRVKYFNPKKGYGFIQGDDGVEYFVHKSDLDGGSGSLREMQRVQFEASRNVRGPQAKRVRAVGSRVLPRTELRVSARPTAAAPVLTFRPLAALTGSIQGTPRPSSPGAAPPQPSLGDRLSVFMGLSESQPSFALGNDLVRAQAFREATKELFLVVEGRTSRSKSPVMVDEIVRVLRERKIASSSEVENATKSLVSFLEPFFRLVEPNARPTTHAAVLDAIRQQVRTAIATVPQETGTRGSAVPPNAQQNAESAPIEQPEVHDSRIAAETPVSEPQDLAHGPGSLLDRVVDLRRSLGKAALQTVLQLFERLRNDAERFDERPLEFTASASLAHTISELEVVDEGRKRIQALLASSEDAAGLHRSSLQQAASALADCPLDRIPGALLERLATPAEAPRVAKICAGATLTADQLPAWVLIRWFDERKTTLERLDALNEVHHADVVEVVDWLEALPPDSRRLLPKCAPPPEEVPLVEYLKRELAGLLEREAEAGTRKARLAAIQPFLATEVYARFVEDRGPESEATLTRAEALVRRLEALQLLVSEPIHAVLVSAFRTWPQSEKFPQQLEEIENAAAVAGPELAREQGNVETLLRLAARLRQAETPTTARHVPTSHAGPVQKVTIVHPLSKKHGASTSAYAATSHWVQQAQQPFGLVRVPARLRFEPAMERDAEWHVDLSSDLLSSIPADWRRHVLTTFALQVRAGATYKDFAIELPISRAVADRIAAENKVFSVSVTASRGPNKATTNLSWQGLDRDPPTFQSPFPQTVSKREMESQPLGVEREFPRLAELVAQGRKSFRVHGPRRMGKTTLVKALIEHMKTVRSVELLPIVVASEHRNPAGLWDDVGRLLSQRFNRPVPQSRALVPSGDAFDAVREEAAAQGISAIYVLIDEAQALFSSSGEPHRLGEAIKARLESSWGSVQEKKATLLLGLVGQAHLPDLMGSNLVGAIGDAFTTDSIRADDLLPLLRAASKVGLQTSAEARDVLARQAGNLWILDRLLARVTGTCLEQGRSWFVDEDVEAAVVRLVAADREGTDTSLWSYVRDVLNESDDKNLWSPSETYAVAMAWAYVRAIDPKAATAPRQKRIEDLHLFIQGWSPDFEIRRQRVDEAFALLRKQRVLRHDDTFELPILERLLAARADSSDPFADDTERESLTRLGLSRVQTPAVEGAESSGGQADVYRGTYESRAVAVRKVRLENTKAEQRFLREVALLEKLKEAPGEAAISAARHVPRLVATGVDPAAHQVGLVIYEWVDGNPLSGAELKVDGALVVLLGLAKALNLLDHLGIVHRDIRPANILIRKGRSEPVLIDFGLSVAIDEISKSTSLGGVLEFIPGEVKERGSTAWTSKGDVFSAGRAIEQSLSTIAKSDRDLIQLLGEMTSVDPSIRPTPEQIIARTDHLLEDRKIQQRADEIASEFRSALAGLPTWTREAIGGAEGDFVASQNGIASPSIRLVQCAEFMENLVAAKVQRDMPETARLLRSREFSTFLRGLPEIVPLPPALRPFSTPETRATGLLRNASAHPGELGRKLDEAYRCLPRQGSAGSGERDRIRRLAEAVRVVANAVAALFSKPEIGKLVRRWVSDE